MLALCDHGGFSCRGIHVHRGSPGSVFYSGSTEEAGRVSDVVIWNGPSIVAPSSLGRCGDPLLDQQFEYITFGVLIESLDFIGAPGVGAPESCVNRPFSEFASLSSDAPSQTGNGRVCPVPNRIRVSCLSCQEPCASLRNVTVSSSNMETRSGDVSP